MLHFSNKISSGSNTFIHVSVADHFVKASGIEATRWCCLYGLTEKSESKILIEKIFLYKPLYSDC